MFLRTSVIAFSLLALSTACGSTDPDDGVDPSDAGEGGDESAAGSGGTSAGGRGNTPRGGRTGDSEGGVPGHDEGGQANSGDEGGQGGSDVGSPGEPGDDPEPTDPQLGARYFLPTPDPTNTTAPTIEVDATGRVHAIYPRYAIGGAFYATCAGECATSKDFTVVELETDGTVHESMLALDARGRPRVLLSTAYKVYYGSCDTRCGELESWTLSEILEHDGDYEVSGEAFALDPDGNPHFLMHTYRAYLGIGQKPRRTHHLSCEADCEDPASWQMTQIATQTWEGSHLRFDQAGRAHVATVANIEEDGVVSRKVGAYVLCESDCHVDTNWVGTGLYEAFEHDTAAVRMKPTVSLALTRDGAPRVVVLGRDDTAHKNIVYFECDEDCTGENWVGSIISNHDRIESGLDLALDSAGRPRIAYTLDFNIGLAYCDASDCTSETAPWDLTKVEFGSDMPTDEIFLWDNCTIAAWFLHDPSLAITPDGKPRIGYQAQDISGGFSQPDPTKPACVAGTDMTWSRVALLPSHED